MSPVLELMTSWVNLLSARITGMHCHTQMITSFLGCPEEIFPRVERKD
jgi:hypothetical protein